MVTELKSPVGDSKGLLVFTHKERPFFTEWQPALARAVDALRERYVLAMQWGAYHEGVGETPGIDVHFACPGTVSFAADVRRVPLCSRDFTPARFRPMDVPRTWDVCCVAHPIRIKRLTDLLETVRRCVAAGHELDVLLVCAVPDQPASLGWRWDHEFFETYRALDEAVRDCITLAVPVEAEFGDRPLHPIPNELFPHVYNASGAVALFSREEGQSKVLHEALCCGTPVVVREDLRGGGRDHLDDSNSLQFSTVEEARDAFLAVADDREAHAFDPSALRERISEEHTVPEFVRAVRGVYEDLGIPFDGPLDTEDLAFTLGGHTLTLPADLRRRTTNDLRSRRAFLRFAARETDHDPSWDGLLTARRLDLRDRLRRRARDAALDTGLRVARTVERHTGLPARDLGRAVYRRL